MLLLPLRLFVSLSIAIRPTLALLAGFFLSLTNLRLPLTAALDTYSILFSGVQPDDIRPPTCKVWSQVYTGASGMALIKVLELVLEGIPQFLLKTYTVAYQHLVAKEAPSTTIVGGTVVGCFSMSYGIASVYFAQDLTRTLTPTLTPIGCLMGSS